MEANFNNLEERLWNYIDGTSNAAEKTVMEKLLQDNAEWRAKYQELLEINSLLQASELEEPSMRFTKNVMEKITKFISHQLPKPISINGSSGVSGYFSSRLSLGSSSMVLAR
ncbi:MAG: hypothetical protein WDO16_23295 [Bacteroidota bacterium]